MRGVATSRRDRDLVTAIVQMARALELRTIAEGAETADQAAALLTLGCGIGQGFLATPAPAPAVQRLPAHPAASHPPGAGRNHGGISTSRSEREPAP